LTRLPLAGIRLYQEQRYYLIFALQIYRFAHMIGVCPQPAPWRSVISSRHEAQLSHHE